MMSKLSWLIAGLCMGILITGQAYEYKDLNCPSETEVSKK
jgi:hypothetical protein